MIGVVAGAGVRKAWLGIAVLLVAACSAPGPAPVTERVPGRGDAAPQVAVKPIPKPEPARPATLPVEPSATGLHTVQRGETLYAVAFANNLDYRDIASWNGLESPDRILAGQVLRLTPPPGAAEVKPLDDMPGPSARPLVDPPLFNTPQGILMAYSDAGWAQLTAAAVTAAIPPTATPPAAPPQAASAGAKAAATPAPAATPTPATASATVDVWLWPADGKLIGRFGAAGGKGIDIVGARKSPVKAVAPGKVVYSGSGLRGYGHLLILKHPGEYLSAYAHNESILVKEGDNVSAGQHIALMGDSDADRVKLHFEIRRYGKPLDPLTYLPERS